MKVTVPALSLVVLVGASGSGKSTFAREHFGRFEAISSDFCRGLVSDDENDQGATKDAFDVLHFVARKRLAAGRLTVVDATNVRREDRKKLVALAREHDVFAVAVVLNLPEGLCLERNEGRPDRDFGPRVVRNQVRELRRSLKGMKKEGFRGVHVFDTPEEVEGASVERRPLWTDRRYETGPFDVVGDVHGCAEELLELLGKLGYEVDGRTMEVRPPEGRKAVFLGDLVDRGPDPVGVLRLVMGMVRGGSALCVPGNHNVKLARRLRGGNVNLDHGRAETLAALEGETPGFREEVAEFLHGLVSHYVLDGGRLVVAHAGMKEEYAGRASGRVRDFAVFGETTGETDEFGLPVRHDWAAGYRGRAKVVYGHTPVPEPEWVNNTINIDTGCAFGGRLTALRYPEGELVSVPARRTYYEPAKPFLEEAPPTGERGRDTLEIGDVLGKRVVETRLLGNVTVREENAAAALEAMSRFAVHPRWLVYLPPAMSPPETSARPDLLEHPDEAVAYYRREGVPRVVCEEKHMGSRAVLVVCRDEGAAKGRFGASDGERGAVYTRTGRAFFEEADTEDALLRRVGEAMERSGLWEELEADWALLDCEVLPWSAKAEGLLQDQYAAVGSAARTSTSAAIAALEAAAGSAASPGAEVGALLERYRARLGDARRYAEAYGRYSWPVEGLEGLKLAPFHLLASGGSVSGGAVHADRDHSWHLGLLGRLREGDGELFAPTCSLAVDLADAGSVEGGVGWWEELTEAGGEGMVVKPAGFVAQGRRGLVQPGIKVRGREYLRLIYGPEYASPENLARLKSRNVGAKRALALREFALGLEALERSVRGEPLHRVHECVFGVLALESEPVDPRL